MEKRRLILLQCGIQINVTPLYILINGDDTAVFHEEVSISEIGYTQEIAKENGVNVVGVFLLSQRPGLVRKVKGNLLPIYYFGFRPERTGMLHGSKIGLLKIGLKDQEIRRTGAIYFVACAQRNPLRPAIG